MSAIILRRRRLGRTSCREISRLASEEIKVVRNWKRNDWVGCGGVFDPITVFRWGCTSQVEGLYAERGTVTNVNDSESIHWCSDKKQGRMDMQAAGVPVPKTFGDLRSWAAHRLSCGAGFRYVMRPRSHAQGRNLLVVSKLVEMYDFIEQFPDFYISELIDKVAEYRVFCCQNRAVWVAKKTPGNPDDVAWNVAQGGRFDNVRWGDWPMAVIRAALAAAKVSGTDFCGVDVMVDKDGNPYVLEVNSAPSQTSPYRQKCVAKVFSHIVANGKQHFDDVEFKNWKDAIHPASREEDDA